MKEEKNFEFDEEIKEDINELIDGVWAF